MRGVESTPGCKRWGCIGGALFLSVPLLQLKSGTGRRIFIVNTAKLNLCSYSLGRWYWNFSRDVLSLLYQPNSQCYLHI